MSTTRLTPLFTLLLAILTPALTGCSSGSPEFAGTFTHAAVAADHAIASRAGFEVLSKGGNAVDAAVATSFTLSVVRPESCGIGGGGFMVIHFSDIGLAAQKIRGREVPRDIALNYREMAPGAVGPDFYEKAPDTHASTHGGKAVGIPGTVAGLLAALDRYGMLDRATVLAPAIRAAEEGFTADQHFVDSAMNIAADFDKNPKWKDRFRFVWVRFCREGKVKVGDVIKLPEQAMALRLIADQGAAAFYRGAIAQAMIETVMRDGGVLTHEDLDRFQVASIEPLKFQAFGRTFLTMPPPSSGGVAMAEAMGILERILHRANPEAPHNTLRPKGGWQAHSMAEAIGRGLAITDARRQLSHPLVESLKHAFADRAEWQGDPAFVDVPVSRLLSPEYLDQRAALFDPERTLLPDTYGTRSSTTPRDDHGTSHFSVVDNQGNAVACTETINLEFGSCLAVDTFGFVLNDQMDDFTTRRGKPNAFKLTQSDRNLPQPGKRPLSSMTPTIILDVSGEVELVAGASGGPRIISGTMQAILDVELIGLQAAEAVSAPRLHHQWSPDVVRLEPMLFDDGVTASDLQSRGHRVERTDAVGNVQLIARDSSGRWQAACDPRKGGRPAGY